VEIPVERGDHWSDLVGGINLPDHEIVRIKTYLNGVGPDDLVYVNWFGTLSGGFEEGEIVDRLIIVGADGAGRKLRRRKFEISPDELLEDVASIYFCVAKDEVKAAEFRYVFADCRNASDKPILICRRTDFESVFSILKMAGSGTGRVWRGTELEDTKEWLGFDEAKYLFEPAFVSGIVENTAYFLKGAIANILLEWGVAPKRGVILHGKPGNGKTVLTRLVAKKALEAGVNVVFLDVDTLWEGVGDGLSLAASRSPVVVILDDLDMYCGRRASDSESEVLSPQRQRFLADLLEFLDGVQRTEGYILLSTSNALDNLDDALRRPGRLDMHIEVPGPSPEYRRQLLQQALAGEIGAPVPELSRAISALEGCSFADVAELVRRYKLAIAAKYGRIEVDQDLFGSIVESFVAEKALPDEE
jgi:ATPase family associated with various cellular activities (AAA)